MASGHTPSLIRDPLRRVRSAGDIETRISRPLNLDRRSVGQDIARPEFEREEFSRIHIPDVTVLPSVHTESTRTAVPQDRPANPFNSTQRAAIRDAMRPRGIRGIIRRVYAFFGYGAGNRARKELVSLIWNISFGFVQIIVTVALVAYSSRHRSPVDHTVTEWKACDRPLGIWNSLWLIRVCLCCVMSGWSWCRDRRVRLRERNGDAEIGSNLEGTTSTTLPESTRVQRSSSGSTGGNAGSRQPLLPQTRLYARLSLLLSLLSMSWFLTAHILVYTSLQTCRFSAPHLWWLTFSILCILYIMVLEIVVIAFVVFIIGPLAFLFWNLFLICIGRHPLQNPHYINPEIGKLSKSVVDRIPLVLYIPSPPETTDEKDSIPLPTPIYSPGSGHSYPPKPAPLPRRRFAFMRLKSGKAMRGAQNSDEKNGGAGNAAGNMPLAWEDNWERGEYPFVRLENNRAACAICLMDFEEPTRAPVQTEGQITELDALTVQMQEKDPIRKGNGQHMHDTIEEVSAVETSEERRRRLQLEDAGEGAQPLRLLPCGHVYHKTCLDPWLTDVSGRCPTCQRPVLDPAAERKAKRRNRGR